MESGHIVGQFYTNLTLRGVDQRRVIETLSANYRRAFVSPAINGMVVVYDEECEQQNPQVIMDVGRHLSALFNCPLLAVMVHDDDVLCYWLFDKGKTSDEYVSSPSYFEPSPQPAEPEGGDAEKLCQAFGCAAPAHEVDAILRKSAVDADGFLSETERHRSLAQVLGLPVCSVAVGYEYLKAGRVPEDIHPGQLVQVG